MAIYFKVDVGYYSNSNANTHPANLSDIIWTDIDKYVSILTTYKSDFPSGTTNIATFQSNAINSFGDDFYKIWCNITGDGNYPIVANNWIPSIEYMYPNLWEIYKNNYATLGYGRLFRPCFYFRKLGKLTEDDREYTVDTLGNLTYVGLYTILKPFTVGQEIQYPFIKNYTPDTNLGTVTYSVLRLSTNTTGNRPSSVRNLSGSTVFNWLFSDNPVPDVLDTDPYSSGGNSTFGGGGGTFADTSDTMDFPTVPYFEVPDAGFVKLYKATIAQLKSLSAYMWTTFDLTAFKKIFADPMDCILGLTMFRLSVPTSGTENIYVGNIDTGIAVNTVSSQYYELDCGSLEIKEFWGAYLDYSPFTKFEIYLPYIGTRSINADEIMGKTIQLKYHIDLLSGACAAYLKSGDAVLYSWAGQCSANVPLTSRDWTNTVTSLIRIASDVALIAGGGNPVAGISDMASSAINAVKPDIEKAGNISGTAGLLGIQTPYLIITRPKQALPEQQNVYAGYPAYVTVNLADISGYCEVDKIHLENIPCTDAELTEIESLLKGGVIL